MKSPIQMAPSGNMIVKSQFVHVLFQNRLRFRKILLCEKRNRELEDLGFEQGSNRKQLFDVIKCVVPGRPSFSELLQCV